MNSRKGFIFTMDAVFALIIATAGVSILLYAHFVSVSTYQAPINQARGTLNTFLQSHFQSIELLYPQYLSRIPAKPKGIDPTGYAVFNGKTSYVQVDKVINYSGTPVTLSAWVYPQDSPQYMISISGGWVLGYEPNEQLCFQSRTGIGTVCTPLGSVSKDKWSFITITISGYENPTITLYINGKKGITGTLTGKLNKNSQYLLGVGSTALSESWFGYLSNVQIYNKLLTSGQIQTLYNNGISGTPIISSNVSIWLPLVDTVADHSPQKYLTTPTNITFSKSLYSAVGNYSINNNESLLSALASMYIRGKAATADIFINNLNLSSNEAIFINNTYAPGLKVANFNGVNSVVTVDESPSMSINQKFTLSLWIYKGAYSNTCESVIGKPSSAQLLIYSVTLNGCSPGSEVNTDPTFKYRDHSGIVHQVSFNKNIPVNKWTQIAAVFNGDILRLYVNGNNTITYTNLPFPNINNNTLNIGYGDSHFNGSIANVQLYTTFLSSSDIKRIYENGLTGQPANYSTLAGWWPLLGNPNDYSGNGNSGYGTNVKYVNSGYTPKSMFNAYQVSKSSIPLLLTDGQGTSKLYNVSVVVWN